ncbi:MAG: hypothetical protein FWD17_08470, partial [Polyangiaceae bacterium]|nr:hypothetical protein [Polyangiaceae bacterium]
EQGSLGGTPLTPFGSALGIDSTAPTDAQLQAALGMMQQTNPRALDDLRMGQDPNNDPAALGGDPVPEYGCGSIATSPRPALATLVAWAALVGLGVIRRRYARTTV